MADKLKTSSSISSDTQHQASPARPNSREAELLTKLADNIRDSYKMVKQHRQQPKLYDLTNQMKRQDESSTAGRRRGGCGTEEWQEVCSPKNKLKRKKTLSASLTSVTDSVNQEKRTRIEGMQLNCRGKLNLKENINTAPPSHQTLAPQNKMASRQDKLASKPPLPPSSKVNTSENNPPKVAGVPPPPRLKRKLQENVQTIQKLNALTEQLRLEINELKSNLTTERGAVRVLRAQNEAESRKWKNEVKKLQNAVELLKKSGVNKKSDVTPVNADILPQAAAVGGLVNYEIQRLTNEINALKEANKALEEKKVINCDADRRKAADIRELKDSYEIRLTQIQKSAKTEISRLLEEIKTKERNIGQLRKDLQTLQNTKNTSRNATTINNSTNKTTTLNLNKKPKNSNNNNNNNNNNPTPPTPSAGCANAKVKQPQTQETTRPPTEGGDGIAEKKGHATDNSTSNNKDASKLEVDNSNEISKLKNIELINNTKNVTTNLQRSTKILSTRDDESEHKLSASLKSIHKQLKALEIPEVHNDCINVSNDNGQFATLLTTTSLTTTTTNSNSSLSSSSSSASPALKVTDATAKMSPVTTTAGDVSDHFEEQHISQELAHHLNTKAIQDAKQAQLHNHHHSDSDSALSSAPPSISPQPPANGVEPTDIWQTIRSYSNDIEKLQKEVDSLHKENEKLRQELNVAKDQIVDLESTALEQNTNTEKHQLLLERIKNLEEQEHQLQAEANDLREQNELLEFRILELEDNTSDKWSLQSNTNQQTDGSPGNSNVWSCSADGSQPKADPFEMLFGSNSHTSSAQLDSGIISPQSQGRHDDLIDITNEELCRRLGDLLKKTSLEEEEKHCLQQVLNMVQQLDALTPRSGPNSLTANSSSSEEASSMDLVKSRISEYNSSTSSPLSSIRSATDKSATPPTKTVASSGTATPRIVATVQPYNTSNPPYSHGQVSQQIVPHNTPTDSPRKSRSSHHWQSNSLSESGVFVESDFLSDSGENNVCTQTDFEECSSASGASANYSLQHPLNTPTKNVPAHFNQHQQIPHPPSPHLSDQRRLQYYKDRLELLEGKVLIYESSGDVQAKRLAERLQREILLEKEVKELRDRVDFLESENCSLEEEKCEFEEAENDTRLRLQRLEVELEILSQRNVELEMSREALSAKYKDCHSECVILREDLATSETHIRHLEEDKQKAKENFEFLHNILPVLLICNTVCTLSQTQEPRPPIEHGKEEDMGAQMSALNLSKARNRVPGGALDSEPVRNSETCLCYEREIQYLKEEVKCLRHQIKELNSRHYAAMESADSHWVDLEREYKEREEQFQAKEISLKQKIQKLQDCLREDARSANEKICQLEEAEQGLKTCLVRVSKEHQKLLEDHQCLVGEFERFKDQHEQLREQQKPLSETLETEKKRNKSLKDELTFMRKLQQETENQTKAELDIVRSQMFDLKKEYLHIEVTNGELREEVATLELQLDTLQKTHRDCVEKVRCLTDEIRTKDEICQKLEKRLERSEGYSLADELGDTPSKRFKREDIKDLQTASKGLGNALRHMNECERMLPTQKQFQTVARDVKKLADTLLHGESGDEEMLMQIEGEINERLMHFHNKQMESQFYCTVYYPVTRPSPQPAESAASSEAHFNRNNENLNTPQPASCPCPTCAVQFHQTTTGLHLYPPPPANYPSCQHGTATAYLCPCWAVHRPRQEHATSSRHHQSSTSSSSTTSEQVPIELVLNLRSIANTAAGIVVPRSFLRPESLPPCCCCDDQHWDTPNSPTTNAEDEFYSCGSASSDSDTISDAFKLTSSSKKRRRKMQDVGTAGQQPSYAGEENAKSTTPPRTQACASATGLQSQIEQLQDLIIDFKDTFTSTLLDRENRPEDECRPPSDQCPCPECFNYVGHTHPVVLSTNNATVTMQGDISACNPQVKAELAHSRFVPPAVPCYCYYMAALAAAHSSVMPMPQIPVLRPSPLNSVGISHEEDNEFEETTVDKLFCICSKLKDVRPRHEAAEAVVLKKQETVDATDAELNEIESICSTEEKECPMPKKVPTEPFNQIHDNHEDEAAIPIEPSDYENVPPCGENEDIAEEQHGHMLDLEPSTQEYDDKQPPYDVVDVTESPPDDEKPIIDDVDMRLQENLSAGNVGGRDGDDEDGVIGSVCEEFDDEHELEKEKRDERQKSRCHKDPCLCCHCQAVGRQAETNKCLTIATTPTQVPTGVEEFKYFVDSLIMDLEAMEHARRKCDVLKNLCASESGVCARESFPVTITDVQELGVTSLYIKWTIHDCYGIGGYEIFLDGYLTNRYYHSAHTAGVVTDVDVSIPHKVALVAQPASMHDSSLEMLRKSSQTKNRCKALPWKTDRNDLWTPSIYLFDPAHSRTLPALPISNDNI